ncbi:SnoaL-like domain-containing protein [Psychroserpens sp.]|jgi:ketosteroid isomerase-like protein|uniref:SnoaL-like domain-containing protein n=1 Tax=Psychroserpens sp. TaxID=2020870 RepID=UPI0039E415E4
MNTNEVAQKWAKLCREGKNLDCIMELYADNVVSKEMPGIPEELTTGKQNVWNKSKQWLGSIEDFHSSYITDPVVAGNFFTSVMEFDCTIKERGRQKMSEVCVYEVKDGKIASEQYFYNM